MRKVPPTGEKLPTIGDDGSAARPTGSPGRRHSLFPREDVHVRRRDGPTSRKVVRCRRDVGYPPSRAWPHHARGVPPSRGRWDARRIRISTVPARFGASIGGRDVATGACDPSSARLGTSHREEGYAPSAGVVSHIGRCGTTRRERCHRNRERCRGNRERCRGNRERCHLPRAACGGNSGREAALSGETSPDSAASRSARLVRQAFGTVDDAFASIITHQGMEP